MVLVGFIPGPKEPQNLDSFLYPLVKEFELLGNGVPGVYNAGRSGVDSVFTMRAFIVSVGADMIGRSKVVYILNQRLMGSVTNNCTY
jgi:hypothetical protein